MPRKSLLRLPPKGDEQPDLFIPDIDDIAVKDNHSLMTMPLLYIGEYRGKVKPVTKMEWISGSQSVKVVAPTDVGIATIRDFDVILFFISVLTERINRGEEISRNLTLHAYSILKFARRGDGRTQYDSLAKALERLKFTGIKMNTKESLKNLSKEGTLSWLDDYYFERDEKTGIVSELKVSLPQWIVDCAKNNRSILTLDKDYFLLPPLGRWLYRLMRKSAGYNAEGWCYTIEELYNRSGSNREYSKWKYDLKKMLKIAPVLEYHTNWVTDKEGNEKLYYMRDEQLINLENLVKNDDNPYHNQLLKNDKFEVWLSDNQKDQLKIEGLQ